MDLAMDWFKSRIYKAVIHILSEIKVKVGASIITTWCQYLPLTLAIEHVDEVHTEWDSHLGLWIYS